MVVEIASKEGATLMDDADGYYASTCVVVEIASKEGATLIDDAER